MATRPSPRRGGARYHTNPNCACASCKARRRTEEAKLERARARRATLEPTPPSQDLLVVPADPPQAEPPITQDEIRAIEREDLEVEELDKSFKKWYGKRGVNRRLGEKPVTVETRSQRDYCAQWAALFAQGKSDQEIAETLGISVYTLKRALYQATRNGWLQFESPAERLEYELVPKAMDNADFFLGEKSERMTIEVLKGSGVFKTHQAMKVDGEVPHTVLAIKIEAPADGVKMMSGQIVGKPRELTTVIEDC